jgi:hypothetical protein
MNDPIVDEVRRIRDAYAARFDYDLTSLFADIKNREQKSGLEFVNGVARQPSAIEPVKPAALSIEPPAVP